MKDGHDLHLIFLNAMDRNVGRVRNHKFSGAVDSTGSADMRMIAKRFDLIPSTQSHHPTSSVSVSE